jgi:hypothetical protein
MDEFIGIFEIIPVTETIAREGARYKGLCRKSHGIGLADGLIAATAVFTISIFQGSRIFRWERHLAAIISWLEATPTNNRLSYR